MQENLTLLHMKNKGADPPVHVHSLFSLFYSLSTKYVLAC